MSAMQGSVRGGKPTPAEALTPKGRNTRAKILQSGRVLMEQRGYFDASVTEITAHSGVALGTFYRYFDNKDALFLQLLETLVDELYESVSGSWNKGDVMVSLRESSRRYLSAYHVNRKLIFAMIQMAGAVPACAALWWQLRKRTYDRMKRYLVLSKGARSLDAELAAVALGSMVEQFAYYWYVEAERNGRRVPSIAKAADAISLIWYRTIYERKGAR